jgi:MoxR-like ATPase
MSVPLQEEDLAALHLSLEAVRAQVSRVYLGSSTSLDTLLVALLARGHVLIEGVPGVAKTTLAKAFAATLGCPLRRIQFTPDLLPADITGTYVLDPRSGSFSLRPGPIFASVVLADEINRAPAKTQSALLEAMQEGTATIEGERQELPSPFLVLATQNPVDLEGTYPLPEAQLDRFLVRLVLGYPDEQAEVAMLKTHDREAPTAEQVLSPPQVLELQSLTRRVHVEDEVHRYAVALCRHTRDDGRVLLGASPRASLSLLQAAKARAVLEGRGYAMPDDVRAMVGPVLAHRLILVPDLDGSEATRSRILEDALANVPYSAVLVRR